MTQTPTGGGRQPVTLHAVVSGPPAAFHIFIPHFSAPRGPTRHPLHPWATAAEGCTNAVVQSARRLTGSQTAPYCLPGLMHGRTLDGGSWVGTENFLVQGPPHHTWIDPLPPAARDCDKYGWPWQKDYFRPASCPLRQQTTDTCGPAFNIGSIGKGGSVYRMLRSTGSRACNRGCQKSGTNWTDANFNTIQISLFDSGRGAPQ